MLPTFQLGGFGRSRIPVAGGGGGGAHRYWRYVNILVSGSLMEISELRLYAGGSAIDTGATITSSTAPTFGSVNDLIDGNLFSRCYWAAGTVEDPAFWIEVDLGSAEEPDAIRIGGYDESSRYPTDIDVEYSDDGSSWTLQQSFSGLTYPGNYTLSGDLAL